ncbi:MAG TPA: sugar-binding protein [Candidatus Avilachnospira avicola]|nr:sugar-binding protein [Candidatus Avilachnospira avicola]
MKKLLKGLAVSLLAISLVGCGGDTAGTEAAGETAAAQEGAAEASGETKTIGICLPTQELARCLKDQEYLTEFLNEMGYEVDVQFAKGDAATQVSQIENMITNGVAGVIISPWNGDALTTAVQKCHDAGIPAIAYDALIMNTPYIEYYSADDLEGIGGLQAQFIVDTLDVENSTEPYTIEIFSGDQADNNANYFYSGAMNILQPYIDAGKLQVLSGQTDRNTTATPEWSGSKAQSRMDTILSTYYLDQDIDAVLTQNDDLAAGVISACKSAGYGTEDKPLPITTGQDCTIAALKSILAGEQTMTVYKDIRTLAQNASYIIDCLVKGETPELENTVTYNNGAVDVTATRVEPIALTVDNLEELIIGNNFYTAEEIGLE